MFGYRRQCNVDPPLIDSHNFMPNGPHERNLFAQPERVLDVQLTIPIVIREVTLPFVRRMGGSRVPINDRVFTNLSGVVKTMASIEWPLCHKRKLLPHFCLPFLDLY